jgi:uncharacterized protein YceH (UPF0502 family)
MIPSGIETTFVAHGYAAAVDLDAFEVRVLGCLVEKQRTTPDAYPLTLNGLRAACNQSTNRDPVVEYDDATIRDALHRLGRRRWTRLAGAGRAAKYRHLLDENPGLARDEQAVLAVLMLRGAQTPGELRQRTERLHRLADAAALEAVLERLIERGFAVRLARRPGQKEERYEHLLSEQLPDVAPAAGRVDTAPAPTSPAFATPPEAAPPIAAADTDRLDRLERELAQLRAQVTQLREELGVQDS